MSTRSARHGFKPVKQETAEAAQKKREAELFLENPVWKDSVQELRDTYLEALLACPAHDDLQRYRLQIALTMIEKVETHVLIAHSHAEVEVKKAVKADVKTSRNPFRR